MIVAASANPVLLLSRPSFVLVYPGYCHELTMIGFEENIGCEGDARFDCVNAFDHGIDVPEPDGCGGGFFQPTVDCSMRSLRGLTSSP